MRVSTKLGNRLQVTSKARYPWSMHTNRIFMIRHTSSTVFYSFYTYGYVHTHTHIKVLVKLYSGVFTHMCFISYRGYTHTGINSVPCLSARPLDQSNISQPLATEIFKPPVQNFCARKHSAKDTGIVTFHLSSSIFRAPSTTALRLLLARFETIC